MCSFTNFRPECADTSLKMARAFGALQGPTAKTRLIGRAKGYHGSTSARYFCRRHWTPKFAKNLFGQAVEAEPPGAHAVACNAFARGMPEHGGRAPTELWT